MAEQGGDRFQAHAAVDRLGGQGVAELVGVDVGQAGGGAGPVDHPGDGMPAGRAAVFAGQQQRVICGDVPGPVGIDEGDQLGVQGQVAVLAELANRDMQPGPGADEHDGIGAQAGVFADPQPSAQQHLHGDADQHPAITLGRAQQPGGRGKEHLQVIGHGQDRVRPAPPRQELQILIQQPDTQPHHDVTGRIPRPDQPHSSHRHAGPPISIRTGLSACQDPYEDHPHIMQIRMRSVVTAMGAAVRITVFCMPPWARHRAAAGVRNGGSGSQAC